MGDLPRRPRVNTDGRGFPASPSSSPRPRTPNNNLHADWRHQYTPPQSPYGSSSSSSLHRIRELESDVQEYRSQIRNLQYQQRDFEDLQIRYHELSAESNKISAKNHDLSLRISNISHQNHLLQRELDDAKYELGQRDQTADSAGRLASAHKLNLEYKKTIFSARKATEDKTRQLAQLYTGSKKHHLAAIEYKELMHQMKIESQMRADLQDFERKRIADEARCRYEFECAKALAADDKLEEAETHFKSVLSKEEVLSHSTSNEIDFDDLTLRLATVISLQDRLGEAKEIHAKRMRALWTDRLDQLPQETRDYVLRHATKYYWILVMEKNYEDAMYYLKKIWTQKGELTTAAMQEIGATIWKSIDILENRKQSEYLLEVLARIGNAPADALLSDLELDSMTKLGTLHLYRGEPLSTRPSVVNRDHALALQYLQRVWNSREDLDYNLFIATGWSLALTSLCLRKYDAAEDALRVLQSEMSHPCVVTNQPSQSHVSGLLAHCSLKQGKFAAAESAAQEVYKQYGLENIFQHLEIPSSLNVSDYHQANTLMLARAKQKQKPKFQEAREVWKSVYDQRSKGWDGKDCALLQSHLEAATMLANSWTEYVKRLDQRPRSGPDIQKEVDKLRQMVVKYPQGYKKAQFDKK